MKPGIKKLIARVMVAAFLFTLAAADSLTSNPGRAAKAAAVVSSQASASKYEAEKASLSGGALKTSKNKGYSGTGYVFLPNSETGAAVAFKVNASKKETVNTTVRYSNGNSSIKSASIYSGSKLVKSINFPLTGGWAKWKSIDVKLPLNAGSNSVIIKVAGKDTGSISLDYISLAASTSKPAVKPTPTPVKKPAPKTMAIGTNFWFLGSWTGEKPFKDGVDFKTTTDPWNPEFLEELAPYSVLRFMDWNVTNLSGQKKWETRRQKTDPKQEAGTGGMNGEPGVAYEWMFDLCNRLKTDCWITVPHLTVEDFDANPKSNYYTELAKLAKKCLDKDRKIYIEYSNENWNSGFEQARYVESRGGAFFHIEASFKLFSAFKEVFADQPGRVKNVIAWFVMDLAFVYNMLDAIEDPTMNPWGVKPDYYAIAPYVGSGLDGASPTIVEEWKAELDKVMFYVKDQYRMLEDSGIEMIAYEFGQHLLKNADVFSRNPAIYDLYTEMMEKFKPYFTLAAHYNHCGHAASGGAWGSKEYTGQPIDEAHKYRALADWVEKYKTR